MKVLIGIDKSKDGFLKNDRATTRFFRNMFDKKKVDVKYDSKNRMKKARK